MTQCERILKYIEDFGSITTAQAFYDLGVASLPRRISDLKEKGIGIVSETVYTKNRYGEPTHYSVYKRAV